MLIGLLFLLSTALHIRCCPPQLLSSMHEGSVKGTASGKFALVEVTLSTTHHYTSRVSVSFSGHPATPPPPNPTDVATTPLR